MDPTGDGSESDSSSQLFPFLHGPGDGSNLHHDVEGQIVDAFDDLDESDVDYDDETDDVDERGLFYYHQRFGGDIPFDLTVEELSNDDVLDDDEEYAEDEDANDILRRILGLSEGGAPHGMVTSEQVTAMLMGNLGSHEMISGNNLDVENLLNSWGRIRRGRSTKDPNRFPKVPSEEGIKLMCTGTFGANDYGSRQPKKVPRRLLDRELGIGSLGERKQNCELVAQALIPGTTVEKIIHYDDPVYSGQFSDDGNFFFSCCQDFRVRMYDTSNPYNWTHYKTVSYPWGQWTLTDASLSPDNRWLAYASIQSMVSIAPTDPNDTGDPYTLELDDGGDERLMPEGEIRRGRFGIWSIRFSGDGRELVAGTSSNSLVVYDIESRRVLHHIVGHDDHVNAVCFADKQSPHILYSGSDDGTLKVWDRRSLRDGREAGAFVGHIEGITYIDSKGDGRYILSNGKDQSMKLWDLRKVMSASDFNAHPQERYVNTSDFDYRREAYNDAHWDVHPRDNSVVTFRGHKVLRTLIRCHFSPPSATNSRYVYSGSSDGKVYIWNMDATLAGTIDVHKATMATRRVDRYTRLLFEPPSGWGTCVRDASWHPSAPMIVASAWNGYSMARGTCSVHAFNEGPNDEAEPFMRRSVDAMLNPNPEAFSESSNVARRKSPSKNISLSAPVPESRCTVVKVDAPSTLRLSARISQCLSPCTRGSINNCRASRRHYSSLTTPLTTLNDTHKQSEAVLSTRTPQQPLLGSRPLFYEPPVLFPDDPDPVPPTNKIHIIGQDERSRFIAHVLSNVYESVELLGWKNEYCSPRKYPNLLRSKPESPWSSPDRYPGAPILPSLLQHSKGPRIDKLVVTGHGHEAFEALKVVKDRCDKDTTICLLNDGLGVLEDVREKIFQESDTAPQFVLGHMSHRLVFNRRYDTVTQLRPGLMKLTFDQGPRMRVKGMQKVVSRPHLVHMLEDAQDLNTSFTTFDKWLHFKLPSVLFDAVVDPVCVLLDLGYEDVQHNSRAQRTVYDLLDEILNLLIHLPELQDSNVLRLYTRSEVLRIFLSSRILAKAREPVRLGLQLMMGKRTDLTYLNGFFIRRGHNLGIDMRMNILMKNMIEAKHSKALQRLNSFVPVEETSIPSDLGLRYRPPRR
ncbi:hypothetical protein E4U13_004306 [Claviceps humidiphila]|uniref:Ketopantoate reductase C-terminal domain-containing protein n=1 Tax=Claviceps humidiphila TaxID=1294629 RepID=A0A9P7PZR4_9HYPO|nr:hypothetical protein E4U13_004306 [Claviceps humidiphila]